ncbi:Hypothetical predicted protein, partial [Pelobates cultripes]
LDKMAPDSMGAASGENCQTDLGNEDTLHGIRTLLARIGGSMLTKVETSTLVREIHEAVREDLVGLRTDLMALEARVDAVETEARLCCQQHSAARTTVTRQGNMLISL